MVICQHNSLPRTLFKSTLYTFLIKVWFSDFAIWLIICRRIASHVNIFEIDFRIKKLTLKMCQKLNYTVLAMADASKMRLDGGDHFVHWIHTLDIRILPATSIAASDASPKLTFEIAPRIRNMVVSLKAPL